MPLGTERGEGPVAVVAAPTPSFPVSHGRGKYTKRENLQNDALTLTKFEFDAYC